MARLVYNAHDVTPLGRILCAPATKYVPNMQAIHTNLGIPLQDLYLSKNPALLTTKAPQVKKICLEPRMCLSRGVIVVALSVSV